MYVLAVEDNTQVLGFRLFSGYADTHPIKVNLSEVTVMSFVGEKKCVVGTIYQSLEFARDEAIRHTKLIREQLGVEYLMYPMPLQELERRMRDWK